MNSDGFPQEKENIIDKVGKNNKSMSYRYLPSIPM
jgi:hypothetical protein